MILPTDVRTIPDWVFKKHRSFFNRLHGRLSANAATPYKVTKDRLRSLLMDESKKDELQRLLTIPLKDLTHTQLDRFLTPPSDQQVVVQQHATIRPAAPSTAGQPTTKEQISMYLSDILPGQDKRTKQLRDSLAQQFIRRRQNLKSSGGWFRKPHTLEDLKKYAQQFASGKPPSTRHDPYLKIFANYNKINQILQLVEDKKLRQAFKRVYDKQLLKSPKTALQDLQTAILYVNQYNMGTPKQIYRNIIIDSLLEFVEDEKIRHAFKRVYDQQLRQSPETALQDLQTAILYVNGLSQKDSPLHAKYAAILRGQEVPATGQSSVDRDAAQMLNRIVRQYPFDPQKLKEIMETRQPPYYKQDLVKAYQQEIVNRQDTHTIRFVPTANLYTHPREIRMKEKFESILRTTGTTRFIHIRGDGNCYYRALIIGAIFSIRYDLQHPPPQSQSIMDFTKRIEALKRLFPERHRGVVKNLVNPTEMTDDDIVQYFDRNRINVDLAIIRNFRAAILEVVQVKLRQQAQAGNPNGPYTLSLTDHNVQALITTMGLDAQAFISLDAASIVLCCPIQVIELRSDQDVHYYNRTDPPATCGRTSSPIYILLKPGHYDLLVK